MYPQHNLMAPEEALASAGGPPPAETPPAAPAPLTDTPAPAADTKPEGAPGSLTDAAPPAEGTEPPKTEEAPAPFDPESFKLTVPEEFPDFKLNDETAAQIKDLMLDEKTNPAEKAQALVNMHIKALHDNINSGNELWYQTQRDWQAAIRADKELGLTNIDQTTATLAKVIDKFGGAEAGKIREAFALTGAGNNPEIVRLLTRVGKLVTEGGVLPGGAPSPAGQNAKARSAAEIMYPSTTQ